MDSINDVFSYRNGMIKKIGEFHDFETRVNYKSIEFIAEEYIKSLVLNNPDSRFTIMEDSGLLYFYDVNNTKNYSELYSSFTNMIDGIYEEIRKMELKKELLQILTEKISSMDINDMTKIIENPETILKVQQKKLKND